METYPRQKLREILNDYSHTICDEPKRLKGLLRDYCPRYTREVNILLTALEQKIPRDLLNSTRVPYELTAYRLVKRLYDDVGMAKEFACWAVDTWALALEIIQIVPQPLLGKEENDRPQPPPYQGVITNLYHKKVTIDQTFEFITVIINAYGKVLHREPKQARQLIEDLGNGVILEMVYISSGMFLMGSPFGEVGSVNSEKPQHRVTLPSFYIGKYPITQAQWQTVMGNNPSYFKGEQRPVEQISWRDSVTFCEKLSEHTGKRYLLPSEAQWEYACRAGTTTPFSCGETITPDLANYNGQDTYRKAPLGQYREETTPVGSFSPNAWGLYDMHGNVWEWCQDAWRDNYVDTPTDDGSAVEIRKNSHRVFRGGSWYSLPRWLRAAHRYKDSRDACLNDIGVRIVGIF